MTKHNRKIICLWILAVLVNIKSAFTDFGTDQAYAVAMSFRHLTGDRLFHEMCEPHQTSAFLSDLLMLLYRRLVSDLAGVALYLQLCGILLYAIVAWILYKELRHHVKYETAQYMCIFFFVVRAKQSVFPEFSNMQICFSVLLFVFLVKFFRKPEKTGNLILAAVFLCLEILAYPACIIVFAGVLILLYGFTERKWKNIALFSSICAICGTGYLTLIISGGGNRTVPKYYCILSTCGCLP